MEHYILRWFINRVSLVYGDSEILSLSIVDFTSHVLVTIIRKDFNCTTSKSNGHTDYNRGNVTVLFTKSIVRKG